MINKIRSKKFYNKKYIKKTKKTTTIYTTI